MTQRIKAVLLDLDGTLYIEGEWIPGARECLKWLAENRIQIRFVTNTTMKSRPQLKRRFLNMGLDVPIEQFFTPARSAVRWFEARHLPQGIMALVHSDVKPDLSGLPLVNQPPADYVLVGDMGDQWNIGAMNRALDSILSGASLTALQKNRRWMAKDGICLDAGAFVAALEFASEMPCEIVFGKPDKTIFQMALKDIGVEPHQAIMVGDDLESDIVGAQRCGLIGVLVQTGKSRAVDVSKAIRQNVNTIETVAELPLLIDRISRMA